MKGLFYRFMYVLPIVAVGIGGHVVDGVMSEEAREPDTEDHTSAIASNIGSKIINLAHQKASKSSFHEAIQLLAVIPEHDPQFREVVEFKNQWSGEILKRGLDRIKHQKISEAIAILRFVPADSSAYAIASDKLKELESSDTASR